VVFTQDQSRVDIQALQIAQKVFRPGCRLPRVAVVRFPDKEEAIEGRLMACMVEVLRDHYYQNSDGLPLKFDAPSIRAKSDFSWMMVDLAGQIRNLGQMIDEADRLAQTDVISQLPNLRTAIITLEAALNQAVLDHESLAILLFDGDNLRQYNQISYEAGDEAIRSLGAAIKGQLHPDDYLARWRTGDEFLVILPGVTRDEAVQIGNRICAAVEQAAKNWAFPSTVSGGIAIYPDHGPTLYSLLHIAEEGLKTAKVGGKNRVVIGGR
jgi:diguanylate cyclase (GGDEF)-like protein